jgi:2-polyprenyl-6-methoxyphenol hydroxylase-like FAD-dependent oxidoreductase
MATTRNRSLTVAVVGAGTAGSAAALLLARAGHQVTLFERVANPSAVGAGITLQPTGQAVLAQLGLLESIENKATRIDGLLCRRANGKPVVDLRYSDVHPSLYGLGLHRGVLFESLFQAACAEPRVVVKTATMISSTTVDGKQRWLHCSDQDASRFGPYDLVIVSDGGACELHRESIVPVRSTPYAWGAMWFVANDPGNTLTTDRRVEQVVDGARHMFGLLPTGRAPHAASTAGHQPFLVSVFWSVRADRVTALRREGLDAWRAQARRLNPGAAPVIDQIQDMDQLLFTQYRNTQMKQWHAEAMVFIGDAAHATSPQLGQGANLALWDASVLADCIAESATINDALAAYTKTRLRHLNYYQFATRTLTPFFQSDSRLAGWFRDATFPMSRFLSPLRRRMVRTMCGLDRGIFRRPIPLASLQRLALAAAPTIRRS